MSELILSIAPETRERLESLAVKMERSVDDCLQLALSEFLDNWEDYTRTLEELATSEEERPELRAVND